jgi:hypothetical protein
MEVGESETPGPGVTMEVRKHLLFQLIFPVVDV